ncbi:exosortase/archaeosortase family protein [Fodinibius salinus]|uniref:Exosortase/archaeosortase family protein n=1 Tax=Fodinibius salinus TaxID=860790 RepID=A0A5D3YP12_9BACT|nr:archaeosortase/exosortase family protein [Fodinibius salinus]TYP95614.1 exosortase/archaeosortase family protein [Fodinibius salinus]
MKWFKPKVGQFILKVLGIYICWYLIYEFWLLPKGSLDAWLTTNIVSISTGILEMFDYEVYASGRFFGIGESPGIFLADGSSGITALGLFVGFVIAYPGKWIPRIAFIIIGIGVIYLVNIFRSVLLAIAQVSWPGFFDFMHNYFTTATFYLVILVLAIVWINIGGEEKKAADETELFPTEV